MNDKVLVTVLIGEPTQVSWRTFFERTWRAYADKHGYDIVVIDDYIDKTPRGRSRQPHWQKLLILEHPKVQGYRHVVWLDGDILINFHAAPCIVSLHASDRIGVVSYKEYYYSVPERMDNYAARANRLGVTCENLYARAGMPTDVGDYANTGVVALRAEHRETLRAIYDGYEENPNTAKEETPYSYHIFKNDLVKPLDPRFNRCWLPEIVEKYPILLQPASRGNAMLPGACVNAAWHNSWFMHFTSDGLTQPDGQTYCIRDDVRYVWIDCPDLLALKLK